MNWNDDWRDELNKDKPNVMERLAECRSTRNDMKIIAKIMYRYNLSKTKEQVLDRVQEWLAGANNQPELALDKDEYDKIIEIM